MESEKFMLMVTYGQISAFRDDLPQPFNDWRQEHVDQGFAWRDGSASFRTLSESGQHMVEISASIEEPELGSDVVRSIKVPFEVRSGSGVEIASISESVSVSLPAGVYSLRCDFLDGEKSGVFPVKLIFSKCDHPIFEIVRADSEIVAMKNLVLSADPA